MPVRIQLLGVQLQLRTDVPHETLIRIVQDVEARARQIMELTRETNRARVFLITALNLALELHETRQTYQMLAQTAGHLLKELETCLQEESRIGILTDTEGESSPVEPPSGESPQGENR